MKTDYKNKFLVHDGLPIPILANKWPLPAGDVLNIDEAAAATGWERNALHHLHELIQLMVNQGVKDASSAARFLREIR